MNHEETDHVPGNDRRLAAALRRLWAEHLRPDLPAGPPARGSRNAHGDGARAPDCNATWDTHGTIANQPPAFDVLKGTLLPQLDAGLGTLIEDLHLRGLLDETLVVAMGEFGRSPKVNPWAGRDHWPRCYSVFLAGGGVRRGHVHGKSGKTGEDPSEDPVTPHVVVATLYSLLGISPETELPDNQGRPIRLGGPGQVIRGIIA